MKNIYIGDIHGLTIWEKIVKEHADADNITFIGDYLDSYNISGIEQKLNLKRIIEFKLFQELDPTKRVNLLIGNHDIHYWRGNGDGGGTAGYQPVMRNDFELLFYENKDHFKMCVQIGDKLCTHAGVSDKFLNDTGYYSYSDITIEDYLNDLFKFKPNEFIFNAPYNRGYKHIDSYGEDEFQSPIWIRPKYLQRANKKSDIKKAVIQIVGHTNQPNLDLSGKTTGGRYVYIDTLPIGQYLIEENGELTVGIIK